MPEEERAPYGAIKKAVADWIASAPAGAEFFYGDIAEDLGIGYPTISAALLKIVRSPSSPLRHGSKRGFYVKVASAERETTAVLGAAQEARASFPGKKPLEPGALLEVVGTLKDGAVLLRTAEGTLWKAQEL